MAWCMDKAKVPEGATVLDPYMGSGTTGIACIRKDGKPSTNAGTGSMLLAFGRENVEAIKRLPGVVFSLPNAEESRGDGTATPTTLKP